MQAEPAELQPIASPSARHPSIAAELLPLQRMVHWESQQPDKICFVQPYHGGQVKTYTWSEAIGEVRRIAAWLKSQGWPAGSKIAILGKNSAAITPELLAWWDQLGLHIVEGYGMTELACMSHSCWFGGVAWGTVGRPVTNVAHRIDPVSGEVQVF